MKGRSWWRWGRLWLLSGGMLVSSLGCQASADFSSFLGEFTREALAAVLW